MKRSRAIMVILAINDGYYVADAIGELKDLLMGGGGG
jgi:hypothetical protein